MKYTLLSLAFIFGLGTSATYADSKEKTAYVAPVSIAKEHIWVAVAYEMGQDGGEVLTHMHKDIYNKIILGKLTKGWLQLRNVHWANDGDLNPQEQAGLAWGYGSSMLIKVEDIERLVPLSDDAIALIEDKASEE